MAKEYFKEQDQKISYKDANWIKNKLKEYKKKNKQIKLDKSLDKQGYNPTLETQAGTKVSAFDNANRLRGGLKKGGSVKKKKSSGKAIRGKGCEIR